MLAGVAAAAAGPVSHEDTVAAGPSSRPDTVGPSRPAKRGRVSTDVGEDNDDDDVLTNDDAGADDDTSDEVEAEDAVALVD